MGCFEPYGQGKDLSLILNASKKMVRIHVCSEAVCKLLQITRSPEPASSVFTGLIQQLSHKAGGFPTVVNNFPHFISLIHMCSISHTYTHIYTHTIAPFTSLFKMDPFAQPDSRALLSISFRILPKVSKHSLPQFSCLK